MTWNWLETALEGTSGSLQGQAVYRQGKTNHMNTHNKKHELALIQISIGLVEDKQLEKWLDLELTVKKTKRHLANLLE